MKAIQYFSDEYLEQCRLLTAEQIVVFLDDFRQLHGSLESKAKSRLISLKVPEDLLRAFKHKARLEGLRYQTQIKSLMLEWLTRSP